MYIGVDIGGTKTLLATLDDHGVIKQSFKFPTPSSYGDFIAALKTAVKDLKHQDFRAAGVAVPGLLDRAHGRVVSLGNLPWKNEPIQADCQKIFDCPVVIENDANLAGLSEAMLHKYAETVLFVTVSTGIGTAVIQKQHLVPGMLDMEGGHILLPYHEQLQKWESFASGRAIYQHFGKQAADITKTSDWRYIARNLALGLFENIAMVQPDLIVIGGSVGSYFKRYGTLLREELKRYQLPIVPVPKIVGAKRPEEAVIYGCYDQAKLTFAHEADHR